MNPIEAMLAAKAEGHDDEAGGIGDVLGDRAADAQAFDGLGEPGGEAEARNRKRMWSAIAAGFAGKKLGESVDWDEGDHPRASDGKFGSGGGDSSGGDKGGAKTSDDPVGDWNRASNAAHAKASGLRASERDAATRAAELEQYDSMGGESHAASPGDGSGTPYPVEVKMVGEDESGEPLYLATRVGPGGERTMLPGMYYPRRADFFEDVFPSGLIPGHQDELANDEAIRAEWEDAARIAKEYLDAGGDPKGVLRAVKRGGGSAGHLYAGLPGEEAIVEKPGKLSGRQRFAAKELPNGAGYLLHDGLGGYSLAKTLPKVVENPRE